MMRDLPPKWTAGFARHSVSSSSRLPLPPASTYAIVERAKGAPEVKAGNADTPPSAQ